MEFTDVRVSAANLLLGEGRGFEIAQGRLGPGRLHHCMRLIGLAERALEMLCRRAGAFGRRLSEQGVTLERIAERIEIDKARWLVLNAAYMMDTVGNRAAKKEIAMIKVAAPKIACRVLDWAIQVHRGAGVSQDLLLAHAYAGARSLRLADGPGEVHRAQIGKLELCRYLSA
jgi:acyl-CoA dehydrogenase